MTHFTKQFREISQFLSLYKGIWNQEIIYHYPNEAESYPVEWIEYLEKLSEEELRLLENGENFEKIALPSLKDFALTCQSLSKVESYSPQKTFETPLSPSLFLKVNQKKCHEIKQLLPLIKELLEDKENQRIIDIGGGIGLLAQTIARVLHYPVTSLDQDRDLQKTGMERNLSYHNPDWPLVNYIHAKLGEKNQSTDTLFEKHALSLGLHTCGGLAKTHLDLFCHCQGKYLINFGCCYFKMKNDSFNISELAKNEGQRDISPTALTLATLAAQQTPEDYRHKIRVKNYRYGLHLFQYEEMKIKNFLTLKSSLPSTYHQKFSDYASLQFPRMREAAGIQFTSPSPEVLDQFFNQETVQKRLRQMSLLGTIRSFMRRTVEVYLLLDRALYLEEKGLKTQMKILFDDHISPRNIALMAQK